MTDPADSDQLHNAVSQQEAIGRHKELMQCLMEGLHTLAECHDQAFNTLLEQFRVFPTTQQATPVIPQTLSNLPGLSLPVLPRLRAAAFFVPLGPLEDSVHHNADVREGTRLGYGGVCHLPQSGGVCGGSTEVRVSVVRGERLLVNCSSYVKMPSVWQAM